MGRFDLKSLQKRIFSALVLIPVVLFAVAWGGWPFYIMVLALTCLSIHEWNDMVRKTDQWGLHALWGGVYILIGFAACFLIRDALSFNAAVMFLFMVWASDSGAYFTGKFIGGAKMAPEISPNKTWAGLIGACGFSALAGSLYFVIVNLLSSEPVSFVPSLIFIFVIGLIIGLAGQGGDLIVSVMKRKAKIKDTGVLIPGHGGLLDRIDSMILAAPVFYILSSTFSLSF